MSAPRPSGRAPVEPGRHHSRWRRPRQLVWGNASASSALIAAPERGLSPTVPIGLTLLPAPPGLGDQWRGQATMSELHPRNRHLINRFLDICFAGQLRGDQVKGMPAGGFLTPDGPA